jgi:hypothetical protein
MNDVYSALEAATGVFKIFALLKLHFRQTNTPPDQTRIPIALVSDLMRRASSQVMAHPAKFLHFAQKGTDIIGG